jgi:hypothetical protein
MSSDLWTAVTESLDWPSAIRGQRHLDVAEGLRVDDPRDDTDAVAYLLAA